jgi:hypothetical protein
MRSYQPKQWIEPVNYLQDHIKTVYEEVASFDMSQLMQQNAFCVGL